MDENNNYDKPWDDGVYGTGPIKPPKNNSGLVAVLLILVIFLTGIVSVLGILNIRMFQRLNQKKEEDLLIAFAAEEAEETEPTILPSEAAVPENESLSLDIQESPRSLATATEEDGMSLQEIYEHNIPSVVSITSTLRNGSSTGTGVILSENGYIVTNNHVVQGAGRIDIQLTDQRVFPADLVAGDAVSDLAVLYIEAENLTPAQFGDSEILRVGDTVAAIGDPLGVEFRGTMTNGIVSAINRDVTVNGRTLNLIQTNAALNSGNSGGPLINCYGQVIGINTMKIGAFTDNAGVEGLGFAIPSATVKEIVAQLISQGYVSGRPALGIQGDGLSSFYQHFYRMPAGLYVTNVQQGSPAAQAGIEIGDILTKVDSNPVGDMDSLNAILYSHNVGDVVQLMIYRNGYLATVELTLTEAKG